MIQITRPVAASRKWLRINGGRIREPASALCRMPPRESQIVRRTKPPPAVTIHAISAAHSIPRLLVALQERNTNFHCARFCPTRKRLIGRHAEKSDRLTDLASCRLFRRRRASPAGASSPRDARQLDEGAHGGNRVSP